MRYDKSTKIANTYILTDIEFSSTLGGLSWQEYVLVDAFLQYRQLLAQISRQAEPEMLSPPMIANPVIANPIARDPALLPLTLLMGLGIGLLASVLFLKTT